MRLGVYELMDRLGAGAMASVWAGRDPGGGRVAIKVAQSHVAGDPRLLRLANEEIRAMARLDHPHIPWVHGWGQVPPGLELPAGAPWLAIDHCSGGSLAEHPPPGFRQVARTLASLLDALAHAHARRVIHGDVKPANVLRATSADERRGVMLADFGLAHVLGSPSATFAGSPSYMAPERIAGRPDLVGPWSDLFSVGALAFELVCRRPAFDGETVDDVLEAVKHGVRSAYRPIFDTPPRFASWIDALLDPDPERRMRRAVAAWRALCRIVPGLPEPSDERVLPRTSGPLRGGAVEGGRLGERPAPFVGREEAQRRCWDGLDAVRAEGGVRVLLVDGAAGVGRTRLLQVLAERAVECGSARVVTVRTTESSRHLSALLASALELDEVRPLARDRAVRTTLERQGVAGAEALAAAMADGDERFGALPATVGVLRAASERAGQPLLLVLDDVDRASGLRDLVWALAVEGGLPAVVVATGWPATDLLRDQPSVETLTLKPLDERERQALVAALGPLEADTRSALVAGTGGHPGWILRRLRAWWEAGAFVRGEYGWVARGAARPSDPGPIEVGDGLAPWLGALDEPDRLDLECAAAQGAEVDVGLWLRTAGDRGRARVSLLERLLAEGWGRPTEDGFRFVHPAMVERLAGAAQSSGRSTGQHLALADALPVEDPRRMWHLAAGGRHGEALPLLVPRGRLTGTIDQITARVELAERLVDATPADDPRRVLVLVGRAQLCTLTGELDRGLACAKEAHELALRADDPELLAIALGRRIDLTALAHGVEARALVEEYEQRFGGGDASELAVYLARAASIGKAYDLEVDPAVFDRAEAMVRRAPPTAVRLAWLLEVLDRRDDDHGYRGVLEVGPEAWRLNLEAGELSRALYALTRQTWAAIRLGRREDAWTFSERAAALALRMGNLRGRAMALGMGSRELAWAGRLPEALAASEESLRCVARVADPVLETALRYYALDVAVGAGRKDLCTRLAREIAAAPLVDRRPGTREHLEGLADDLRALGLHDAATDLEAKAREMAL